jgi:hypothetical protein
VWSNSKARGLGASSLARAARSQPRGRPPSCSHDCQSRARALARSRHQATGRCCRAVLCCPAGAARAPSPHSAAAAADCRTRGEAALPRRRSPPPPPLFGRSRHTPGSHLFLRACPPSQTSARRQRGCVVAHHSLPRPPLTGAHSGPHTGALSHPLAAARPSAIRARASYVLDLLLAHA